MPVRRRPASLRRLASAPANDGQPQPPAGVTVPTGPACKIRKEHYSGTWSHTDRSDLKAPKEMSKTDFGKLLVQTCTAIFMTVVADGMARARHNRLFEPYPQDEARDGK